jgi:hypothetical protein
MATKKKTSNIVEQSTEVAAPKIKTNLHTVIRAGFGLIVGQKIGLNDLGVQFYKSNQIIK